MNTINDLCAINDKWERLRSHVEDRRKNEPVKVITCDELLDLMIIIEQSIARAKRGKI